MQGAGKHSGWSGSSEVREGGVFVPPAGGLQGSLGQRSQASALGPHGDPVRWGDRELAVRSIQPLASAGTLGTRLLSRNLSCSL